MESPQSTESQEYLHSVESKEGLVRRSTVSHVLTPSGGNRLRSFNNNNTTTNVTNPMFGRNPDPLRCSPYDGEQFHEVIERDPNCSVFPRREEPEFANRRLTFHAAPAQAVPVTDPAPTSSTLSKPPHVSITPIVPIIIFQGPKPALPKDDGIFDGLSLTPILMDEVIHSKDHNEVSHSEVAGNESLPAILVTDADNGSLDEKNGGKENVKREKTPKFFSPFTLNAYSPSASKLHSPSTSKDSAISHRGAESRTKAEFQHSLTKSHSLLGIDISASSHGQENMLFGKSKKKAEEKAQENGGEHSGENVELEDMKKGGKERVKENVNAKAKENGNAKAKENGNAKAKENGKAKAKENGEGSNMESAQEDSSLKNSTSTSKDAARPVGGSRGRAIVTDMPNKRVPSCVGLPEGWNSEHDRCIAYLSTHAPLTASGKIPPNEATLERYSIEEISDFLIAHFDKFRESGLKKISHSALEKRLEMLDSQENDFFSIKYGGYSFTDWGSHI